MADYYNHQIKNLVKKGSTSYIPRRTGGASQTLLELGSICVSLKIAQEALWDTYSKREQDALASLFLSYGEGPTIGSNWQFFNAFILSFLKDRGYKVKEDYLRQNLENLLARYRGEGWYNDAPAYDYYSMWAFQTYGPFLAHYYRDLYPDLADKFIANQHDLVDNYPYMFARDGRMNMWGRSLPYRFAAVSPFAFLEYNDKEGDIDYGWLRHISSASLLQFMKDPNSCRMASPRWDSSECSPPACRSTAAAAVSTGSARHSSISFCRRIRNTGRQWKTKGPGARNLQRGKSTTNSSPAPI